MPRSGSDCLDRREHRKLAPFNGVENRVHLGQTNAHIFLHYCEDDVVLVGKESVYLADADRRFFRQFSRCCRIKALRTPPPPPPPNPGTRWAIEPMMSRRARYCPPPIQPGAFVHLAFGTLQIETGRASGTQRVGQYV